MAQAIRAHLSQAGLIEIETPILFKSTPEGARDYLVPSRVHPGSFYALPQSPQLLKQVLMIAGFEGYFQLARCFRDEDLRANRQPEFTQVDLEIAFGVEEDVYRLVEGLVATAFAAGGVDVEIPFRRLTHAESMAAYGSDKPDLRFGMTFADLTGELGNTATGPFAGARERGAAVLGLAVPGGAAFSRKDVDELTAAARGAGAPGLAFLKVGAGDGEPFSGPLVKHLETGQAAAAAAATGAVPGDLLLLVSGPLPTARAALCAVRLAAGERLGLRPKDRFVFAWIHDFPLFEVDPATGAVHAAHHPFCMPREEDLPRLASDPASVRARTYDLTCNGEELGTGSIRIHRRDVQAGIFERIGLSAEQATAQFGFFLEALGHGAPPHCGIALGLDRMVMLLAGEDNLRNVIAFPKTSSAADLMAGAPAPVAAAQLRELALRPAGGLD